MIKRFEKLIEMAKEGKSYCAAQDIAEYLDADPATIRAMARNGSDKLGLAAIVIGKRVCFPIVPFIMTMTGASYEAVEAEIAA